MKGEPTDRALEDLSVDAGLPGILLPRVFFESVPDVVARALLGKLLVRRTSLGPLAARIVEVEAYFGDDDPAAHAAAGRTARNSVLFGPPGHSYVYFIYGMHSCLNVSCEPEGHAGCVLVRALEPLRGLEQMAERRSVAAPRQLCSGPGRLCQAFGITRATHNGVDLLSNASDLQLREDGYTVAQIAITPRIGISKAADRPLRFLIPENVYVSASRGKDALRKKKHTS